MSGQKYTDDKYLEIEYFLDDETITNYSMRIVKTRKDHECSSIYSYSHLIPKGTKVLKEVAIDVDIGWVSNYLCLTCANEYLKEIYD